MANDLNNFTRDGLYEWIKLKVSDEKTTRICEFLINYSDFN